MIVRSALASNAAAARALPGIRRAELSVGKTRQRRLYGLPLVSLDIEENHLAGLKRAGLRSVGDVDVLPRGCTHCPLWHQTCRAPRCNVRSSKRADFATPHHPGLHGRAPYGRTTYRHGIRRNGVAVLEPDELFLRLQQRVEGAREIEASFFRADGNVRRISVQTGRPVTETKTLFRLLKERLSTLSDPLDAGYGFDLIRLAASTCREKPGDTKKPRQQGAGNRGNQHAYRPAFHTSWQCSCAAAGCRSTHTFPNAQSHSNLPPKTKHDNGTGMGT